MLLKASQTECDAETITFSHAAGIAKGRPFEKLVRSGIFDLADRGQEMLARRSAKRTPRAHAHVCEFRGRHLAMAHGTMGLT